MKLIASFQPFDMDAYDPFEIFKDTDTNIFTILSVGAIFSLNIIGFNYIIWKIFPEIIDDQFELPRQPLNFNPNPIISSFIEHRDSDASKDILARKVASPAQISLKSLIIKRVKKSLGKLPTDSPQRKPSKSPIKSPNKSPIKSPNRSHIKSPHKSPDRSSNIPLNKSLELPFVKPSKSPKKSSSIRSPKSPKPPLNLDFVDDKQSPARPDVVGLETFGSNVETNKERETNNGLE